MLDLDKPARRIVSIMAMVALLCLIGFGFAFCQQRKAAQEARGTAAVGKSQSGLGADALARSDALTAANEANRAQTQANTDFIEGAGNAKDSAGDAGDRGRLAYCERQRMRGQREPEYCAGLRRAYPAFGS